MAVQIALGCSCGAVTGTVTGVTRRNSRRLSCMCDDCQLYAHFLGSADRMLDALDGTELSYATQSRVFIRCGVEHLQAVKLSEKGMLRFYTSCCRTPVANVPHPKMAFVGIPRSFMQHDAVARDEVLGPLFRRFQGRFGRGELPVGAHLGTPLLPWLAAMISVTWDSLTGKYSPSPFHDASGNPVVAPRTLTPTEREALAGFLPKRDARLLRGNPISNSCT
jgi:hypothetical protein